MTLKDDLRGLLFKAAGGISDMGNEEIAEILALIKKRLPEKKPRVVKRHGYYPPFQPQVEQHEHNGWNACLEQFKKELKE